MAALKLVCAVPGWVVAPGVWATPAAGVVAVAGPPKRPPAGLEVVGVLSPVVGPGVPGGLPKRPPETAGVSAGFVVVGLPKRVPAGGPDEEAGGAPKRDCPVGPLGAGALVDGVGALLAAEG